MKKVNGREFVRQRRWLAYNRRMERRALWLLSRLPRTPLTEEHRYIIWLNKRAAWLLKQFLARR